MARSRDVAVGESLLSHLEAGTTEQAENVVRMPVQYYLDPELWQREMTNIFKRLPLMLAFSTELASGGDYKAMEVVGVPVLILRGRDGRVRAFLNVCRHRGARLKEEGVGSCRRIVCPYHAWSYDHEGKLVGIYKPEQFGPVDPAASGLRELPCREEAGLVFVSLTPDRPMDLEAYLGPMLDELRTLGIEEWKVHARRELPSANWKATHDGYVDGYHLEVLHPKTVGLVSKGALNTFEGFGPHQKIGFANQDIEKLRDKPSSEWAQDEGFGFVRTLFPNVSFAVRAGAGGLVSQLLPGPTPDRARTIQSFVRARLPETDQEKAMAEAEVELFHAAVRDEDYATVDGVQQGMESGAIEEVVFGRNEIGNQRLHQWIAYYTQDDPKEADRPTL